MKTNSKSKVKTYTKKHYSGKAIDAHKRKIKKRGGTVVENDMTLTYSFPKK